MAITQERRRALAWGECFQLTPSTAVDQLEQLAAVATRIAIANDGAGFRSRPEPSSPGEPHDRWALVTSAADKAIAGTFNGNPLPTVAALWEVDASGAPDESAAALPDRLKWLKDSSVVTLGEFKPSADSELVPTRRFRLFMPKDLGASQPAAFASSLTRTGLAARASAPRSRVRISCAIALAAGLLFCWSAGCMNWSGKQFAQGVQLLQGNRASHDGELALLRDAQRDRDWLVADVARDACIPGMALTASASTDEAKSSPHALSASQKVACLQWWAIAMKVAHSDAKPSDAVLRFPIAPAEAKKNLDAAQAQVSEAQQLAKDADCVAKAANASAGTDGKLPAATCAALAVPQEPALAKKAAIAASAKAAQAQAAASAAMNAAWPPRTNDQSLESSVFGAFAPDGVGATAQAATMSLITPLVLMMASVLTFVFAAGLGVTGLGWGAFINAQNRVSLARCQVVAWSILILPTAIAFACFNAGVMGQFGDVPPSFNVFPTIPGAIWAALGISIASTMLSPVLLSAKDSGTPLLQVVKGASTPINSDVSGLGDAPSKLSTNSSASRASFSDLFLGEETGNDSQVDISRLQMMIITVGLVATYADMIFAVVGTITMADIAHAVTASPMVSLLSQLPQAGATFTAMLAISHGAYIVTKAASTTPNTGADSSK